MAVVLTQLSVGFTVAGGTTSKTLTVPDDADVSGTNTGDVTLSGENYLSISGQNITANPVDLSSSNVTGQLPSGNMATSTANTLAGYDNSGNFSDVAIGSGLSLSGGTLTASGGGSLSTIFGTGFDGNVTVGSGGLTLTRDMFFNNLTLNATSGQLVTAGYRIYTLTLDISAALSNAISPRDSSVNGTDASGTNDKVGGLNGLAALSVTVGGGTGSQYIRASGGQTGNGLDAYGGEGPDLGNGGAGATAGNAGNGDNGSNIGGVPLGGGGGPIANWPIYKVVDLLAQVTTLIYGGASGGPGPGAAGDGTNYGGGGGGCGAGGGVLEIFAQTIIRGTNTNPSIIFAGGGNGGNGGSPTTGNCGGGAGGGAGGGGWIYLVYQTLTGSAITDCLDASGGNGGDGGTHCGGAGNTDGTGGTGGNGGRITVFNVSTNTCSETDNTGTAGSGPSGTAGGAGVTTQVTL